MVDVKAQLLLHAVLIAALASLHWLWQRRGQAVLGLLVFGIGIGGSALQPGHWWAH
ncbi:hypothetical protein [Aquincola tertiaricarbonis]|uniref:hypothetical protein n=1 Tax=Aquincola tertiaricarbonis TaxID=391953 RepID=UPI0012EE5121|nr:hypothetical protein [Aquincola tertiaricarbonis]